MQHMLIFSLCPSFARSSLPLQTLTTLCFFILQIDVERRSISISSGVDGGTIWWWPWIKSSVIGCRYTVHTDNTTKETRLLDRFRKPGLWQIWKDKVLFLFNMNDVQYMSKKVFTFVPIRSSYIMCICQPLKGSLVCECLVKLTAYKI